MTHLVDELISEHQSIVAQLNEIKLLGVTSDEGQRKLALAKAGLLAHLEKEDHQLYPTLKREAKTSPELKRTLELFAKDMDKISNDALEFFKKYENGGSGIEFAKEFGLLLATLSQRIHKEENIIYAKYNSVA